MPLLTIPTTFTAYTKIKSSEVNANFAAISTLLNTTKLDGTNIQNGGIDLTTKVTGVLPKANGGTGVDISTAALPLPEIASPTTPSSGTVLIYGKNDHKLYVKDSTGTEKAVGSGSGQLNYIAQPDAEGGTTGWATYNDAAGTTPVDGTGGSPAITWTTSSSSPIRGASAGASGNSFLLTKTGTANRQGDGVSYDFTIDAADKAKVLTVSFEYAVNSGTFATGDVVLYIYDVTGATLIQPSNYQVATLSSGTINKHIATFQTSTNTSYRFILHVSTTSTSDYVLKLDNIVVGPQTAVYGAPVTSWQAFTPTGSWSANSTYTGQWRRVGDSMECQVLISLTGAPTAAGLTVNVPSGYSIHTGKMVATSRQPIGQASYYDISVGAQGLNFGQIYISSSTAVACYYAYDDNVGTGGIISSPVDDSGDPTSGAFASGDEVHLFFSVPITGWESTVVMSDSTDTRVVAASFTGSSTSITSAGVAIVPTTTNKDSHGAFSSSTYTVPVPGDYTVAATLQGPSAAYTAGDTVSVQVKVNGGTPSLIGVTKAQRTATDSYVASGAILLTNLKAGDTIIIYGYSTVTGTILNYYASINRLSGPSAIAASETVAAVYNTAAGQTFAAAGTIAQVDFGTKVDDSHNAVTTGASWKYSAPVAGRYLVSATIMTTNASWTAGNALELWVYKNGSALRRLYYHEQETSTARYTGASGTTEVQMVAGDYIDIRAGITRTGGTTTLFTNANDNHVTIVRVGN